MFHKVAPAHRNYSVKFNEEMISASPPPHPGNTRETHLSRVAFGRGKRMSGKWGFHWNVEF